MDNGYIGCDYCQQGWCRVKDRGTTLKKKEREGRLLGFWAIYMARRRVTAGVADGERGQRGVTRSEEKMTMA